VETPPYLTYHHLLTIYFSINSNHFFHYPKTKHHPPSRVWRPDDSRSGLNRMLDGFPTRAAWALCTFAYSAGPGTEPILFEGRTDGKIVAARGPPKFGWDPIFEAEDTGLT
jgi:hypothetical protein